MNSDDDNKTDKRRSFRLGSGVTRLWLFLSGLWIIFMLFLGVDDFFEQPKMIFSHILIPSFVIGSVVFGVHWVRQGFRKDKEK